MFMFSRMWTSAAWRVTIEARDVMTRDFVCKHRGFGFCRHDIIRVKQMKCMNQWCTLIVCSFLCLGPILVSCISVTFRHWFACIKYTDIVVINTCDVWLNAIFRPHGLLPNTIFCPHHVTVFLAVFFCILCYFKIYYVGDLTNIPTAQSTQEKYQATQAFKPV